MNERIRDSNPFLEEPSTIEGEKQPLEKRYLFPRNGEDAK